MGTSLLELLEKYKVVIPILQRDYAHGRMIGKIPEIRNNFLNAFCKSIKSGNDTLELDFIYGYTRSSLDEINAKEDIFFPLDGQQRLTTLFLFHWYIAVKEGYLDEAQDLLAKFTYETRHSSEVFCSELVKYQPENLSEPIKNSIINQPWFFTAWNNDPTISSMLVMLNAIQIKVDEFNLENVWETLTPEKPAIVFHLLSMDKLGLPDDLYIKMNSRGKELTEFEYFKSQFSELLSPKFLNEFNVKVDQVWSDLLWDLYKDDIVPDIAIKVDASFLNFFRYVTDIIIAKKNITNIEKLNDLNLFKKVYSDEENVKYLFSIFDLFADTNKDNPEFFSSIFYIETDDYDIDKTRLFFGNPSINLFKKCSNSYDTEQRINPFSIGEQLLLYACIVHLQKKTTGFKYRLRKLRNLINNSEDTVRKENMPSLINSVYEFISNYTLEQDAKFNKTQVIEEERKSIFIQNNFKMLNIVNKLEDNHLLRGCIGIFKLDTDLSKYAIQFNKVFHKGTNYDSISRALFTFGDYSQKINKTSFIGNKFDPTWRDLFTPSQRRGDFKKTQKVLYELLDELYKNPSYSIETIINSYLELFEMDSLKEKDWNYYFIKYPAFRKHQEGYYLFKDSQKYDCIMIRRKTLGGFHWNPFLRTIMELSNDSLNLEGQYGQPLVYVKDDYSLKITTDNKSYKFESYDINNMTLLNDARDAGIISSDFTYKIKQSPEGYDIEDRIQKGLELIDSLNNL